MPRIVSAVQIAKQGMPWLDYGVSHGYETCLYCWLYGSSKRATYELVYELTSNRIPLCDAHAAQAERELKDA